MRALLMALALGAPGVATAHPFATRTAAHRLAVVVDLDAIRVDYTVEAPFAGNADDPTATARELDVQTPDEVTNGLLVLVDGASVPLRLDPERKPRVRASAHTATVRVWLEADAPAAPEATIVVSNANYPDLPGQFWVEAWADAQVDVHATDLLPEGPDGDSLAGRWRTDEAARSVEIRARFHRGRLAAAWQRLGGQEGLLRPVEQAAPASARSFWAEGTLRPAEFGGLALVAIALAALLPAGGATTRRQLALGAAATAAPALLLAILPASTVPTATATCGLVATGLAAWAMRGGPRLPAAAAGLVALSLTTARPGYAALLAVVSACAMALTVTAGARDGAKATKVVAALVTCAGLVALGRGVASLLGAG